MPAHRFLLAAALVCVLRGQQSPEAILQQLRSELDAGHYATVVARGHAAADQFLRQNDRPSLVRALTQVGLAEMYSGLYDPALATFQQAADISRAIGDLQYEITSQNNIGTVEYFTGHYSEAMDAYRRAAALVDGAPQAGWLASRRQLTLANTAILYQTLGQYDRALTMYNDLLAHSQALPLREQAQVLANIGVLRRRLGDPQKAFATYRSAQALFHQTGHSDGEISVLNDIGILQTMDLRDFPAAIATLSESFRRASESGNRPLMIHARLYRGETYFRAGQMRESADDFQAAAEDAARLGEREEEWKADFGLARVLLGRQDRDAGLDLLRHAVGIIEGLRANLSATSLRSTFLANKRDVYDLLIANSSGAGQVFHYMEQSRARELTDRVAASRLTSLENVERTLPAGTVLLEYWMADAGAKILWIFDGQAGLEDLDLTDGDRRAAASIPAILADEHRGDWQSALEPLAGKLLANLPPLHDPRARRLIVVPDGSLSAIPFEALPFDHRPLLSRFTISYLPAAGLLPKSHGGFSLRWFWQSSVEAFADPAPGAGSVGGVDSIAWARLPMADREIAGIARALGGPARLYSSAEATKVRLRQAVRAPVLHFATHAFADLENPGLSYILLAPQPPSTGFDHLYLREIGGLPLRSVRLVTLSACQTAVGKDVPGEGIASFNESFLAAGVPAVVASLWAVPDRATAQLMLRFYAYLAAGEPLADALRHAKLDFLQSKTAAHPANWAAFVLSGDPGVRLPYFVAWQWLLLPIALAAATIVVIRRRGRKASLYRDLHRQ